MSRRKNTKPFKKKDIDEQKSLKSFRSKQIQSFTKDKILYRHFTEKLPITKMGLNTRREKEKKFLLKIF